ncbi:MULTISPECIES: PhzF family phenazine biosynthesis protein [Parachlamydia]|jgi:PhzF family phenazine biosynthesis protein|uniref:PhzF family phenazine biosynthesis protein n=1 Tax=Parachlamydia TaxID=83551 RepID=UPI0001C17A5B|nr:PhzF family phenazine biosynthesis protein [Parachlamydia acanthamoebae]EFB42293.1 hypothetical protein pah_c013o066 [Parachlamydia acanthamoebae str. Hall's coccus]
MRTYTIHHTDSFTNTLFGGNPTVTVIGADSLHENEMKNIAREMNLSETGFIQKSEKADFRLRFFTPPGNEIKFCGHATVGALNTIAHEGLYGCTEAKNFFTIETNAGILDVEIDLSKKQTPHFIFDAPKIQLESSPYNLEETLRALDISKELIDVSKAPMLEKTNQYLYLTARNLKCLEKINLNPRKAIEFASKDQIVVFCFLTHETFSTNNHIHARGFAPLVGVPEDPFTGSMQGGLAAYALDQKIVQSDQKWIHVEQGHFMHRPGFAKLEIMQTKPVQVKLHAEAMHVFASQLKLP